MNEIEIQNYLKTKCPEFIWKKGSGGLIDRWTFFVEDVEKNGYSATPNLIEEYQNDLDTRALIREVGLDKKVEELDKRFINSLTKRDFRVWGTEGKIKDDFWNFGYPKKASGLFLESIKQSFEGKI